MLNEKIFKIVKKSMLSDRNLEAGIITEQKITDKFIEIIVKDHGDIVKVKRETKENLKTYWNLSILGNVNYKMYIEEYKITFTEFRTEIERLIDGEVDIENKVIDELIVEAFKNISNNKLVGNKKR